ncbi:MAG: 2-C-methyl-D-erythritol 2,4-cyclodiphosphate synthase [Candidatus Hydrogenedentota bacterium]
MTPLRIGQGYDLHRLEAGRPLTLGGISIPFAKGLAGHSDADVLTHAIIDALLGAAVLGDIGQHFPDMDPAHKNADSLDLLRATMRLLGDAGYTLVNVDSTIVAQAPKLGPHLPAIRGRLADAAGIPAGRISVKAKTNEYMGPEGLGEAISVHAVALLESRG